MSDRPTDPVAVPRLRWWLAGAVVLATLVAGYYVLAGLDLALALWARLDGVPAGFRYVVLLALAVLGSISLGLIVLLLRSGRRRAPKVERIERAAIEQRLDALAEPAPLQAELHELDRRRALGELQVALFGEVSTGKSSLLRALAPDAGIDAATDVAASAGTTRRVQHARGRLPDGRELVVADVPGSNEAGGDARAALARDEAARAHALVFVADGDLSRQEDVELRALADTRRPLLLALNQSDRYDASQRAQLLGALQQRYGALGVEVVAVSAGGSEQLEREFPDGRREPVTRERPPRLDALQRALGRIAAIGAERLEPARELATLRQLERRVGDAETRERGARADAIVQRYTRRAMVGAMAAVAPGTDLLIQGALASAMLRELTALYDSRVREIDLDGLLAEATRTVRSHTAIVLAIAGNAMKAFPGLGTLGGGLVHTLAYGLIFDSLGHALVANLAAHRALDREATLAAFRTELERPGGDRLQALARLAWDAWRDERGEPRRSGTTP